MNAFREFDRIGRAEAGRARRGTWVVEELVGDEWCRVYALGLMHCDEARAWVPRLAVKGRIARALDVVSGEVAV